jgi:hypothetical protein
MLRPSSRATPSSIMKNPPRHASVPAPAGNKQSDGPPWGMLAYEGTAVPYDSDALVLTGGR